MLNLLSDNFLCSVIDTSEDYKSNDSDNGSIYSADISLEDYESNGSIHSANEDYESNGFIHSADISLEDYESNGSIHSANEDYESNDLDNGSICSEDYFTNIFLEDESNNSDDDSIYSADISLENYDLNDDVINDTNRSIDYGKNFNLLDLKCKHNFTNNAYTDILNLIEGTEGTDERTTLYLAEKKLTELVNIRLNQ